MSQQLQPVVFGVNDVPQEIEEAFRAVLVEPAIGYYRSSDLEPFLPYWGKGGVPAMYYVKNSMGENEIRDVTQTRGDVFDDEGFFRGRIYRTGDVTMAPQLPVLGHRLVKEFVQTYIEMSRAWLPFSDDKVLGTGSLYHRFEKFIKPELMVDFPHDLRDKFMENSDHLSEITMDYLNRAIPIPAGIHVLIDLLKAITVSCQNIIQPVKAYITENPWQVFDLVRLASGDYLLIPKGDFRILQWEKQTAKPNEYHL